MNNLTRGEIKGSLSSFFGGKCYPIIVCALALLSSIFALEVFILPITVGLFIVASLVSDTARPLIITFLAVCLHISPTHSPSHTVSAVYGNGNADYLFSGWRFGMLLISFILGICAATFFFIKNKCYKRILLRRDPVFISTVILSISFLLGGAFCEWYFEGLALAVSEVAVFLIFYTFFAYGFSKDESTDELMEYFSFVSVTVALTIILQLICLYFTSDIIFISGGINKEGVMLGWGIWTLIGITIAMLIPPIFFGVMRGGVVGFAYFSLATLTFLFSILSMSRAAQIISTLVYVLFIAVAAFKSKNRFFYKIILGVIIFALIAFVFAFWNKIPLFLKTFLDDNGRVEHAKIAIQNFFDYPFFGVGFSGFEKIRSLPESFSPMGPLPAMAHSTPLELLSATGAFGFLAYSAYRVATVAPVLKKHSFSAMFALVSSAVPLIGGLVDNFPFDIYPMFYSLVALAIAHKSEKTI